MSQVLMEAEVMDSIAAINNCRKGLGPAGPEVLRTIALIHESLAKGGDNQGWQKAPVNWRSGGGGGSGNRSEPKYYSKTNTVHTPSKPFRATVATVSAVTAVAVTAVATGGAGFSSTTGTAVAAAVGTTAAAITFTVV